MAKRWPVWLLSLPVATCFALISFLLFISLSRNNHVTRTTSVRGHKHAFHAPFDNIWAELTAPETRELYSFLYDYSTLNLTRIPLGKGVENYIGLAEVLRPNKTDALAYLDRSGPRPGRWARIAVISNHEDTAFVSDYAVGPLPIDDKTRVEPLIWPYNSGRNWVRAPITNYFEFLDWALAIGEDVADITMDLYGKRTNRSDPEDPNGLLVGSRPALIENGNMVHWLEFFGAGGHSDARSLLPQGLYVKLNTTGPRSEDWQTGEWYYGGILYPNLAEFRKAWSSPSFVKVINNKDGPWTDTEVYSSPHPARLLPPPMQIQPYGARYRIDKKQNYVSYFGWTFHVATSQFTALSLFDIRFNNTRIFYQLGLQEALAHYAGSEPMQSGLEFLDTFFGMGQGMYPLVPGYDCSTYADYLDMSYHKGEESFTHRNAICVFEYTADAPLQRHTSHSSVSVSRNTYLIVRSVSTIGNYDYTIDYIFYLDGSVEVKVRASGFIFAAFAPFTTPNPDPSAIDNTYGYRIHDAAFSSMHDHVINFRADLDVAGDKNTFQRVDIVPHSQSYPWDHPEVPSHRHTMHLTRTTLDTETAVDWPKNSGSMYLISSTNLNSYGENRTYRILPGTGIGTPSHLTIINSTILQNSASWSSSDLFILRAHDAEPASAHHMNYFDPKEPLIDFAKMVDGESIVEEDLVVYFNLGAHHIPGTQDIPNTLMHGSASSVIFMPHNYFDYDVSRDARVGVRIDEVLEKDLDDEEPEKWGFELLKKVQKLARRVVRRDDGDGDDEDNDDDEEWASQVRHFGGRYKEGVKVKLRDLEADLSEYMDGKSDDEEIDGGLLGLFGARKKGTWF